MQIQLQAIVPIPLRDRPSLQQSTIWGKNINFETPQKVKIKAPSGTGKTTLIHSMYGLRNDYTGSVNLNQTNINQISADNMATIRQYKLSVIFQDLQLFTQLTALENIELKRILQKPFYEASKIGVMAERLGVSHILNNKLATCSYGERQRIAIIRACIQPFELLLMDEPFSHIDEANTAKAVALIEEECAQRQAGFILCDLDDDTHFNYDAYYTL
jgi:ABC-type lipoprotein export system ATPase subunit